jgi:hypothetical protein
MKTGVKFSYPSSNKLRVIKALREVTGMGLKEAKDISEAGWVDAPAGDVQQVYRALRPLCDTTYAEVGKGVNPRMGLERIRDVLYRIAGRGLNRVATHLEQLEMKVWG